MEISRKKAGLRNRTRSYQDLSEFNRRDVAVEKSKRLRSNEGGNYDSKKEKDDSEEGAVRDERKLSPVREDFPIDRLSELRKHRVSLIKSHQEFVKTVEELESQGNETSILKFVKGESSKLEAQIERVNREIEEWEKEELEANKENISNEGPSSFQMVETRSRNSSKSVSSRSIPSRPLTPEEQFELGSNNLLRALERQEDALTAEKERLQSNESKVEDSRLKEVTAQLATIEARRQRILSFQGKKTPPEFINMIRWGSIRWKLE